MIFRAQRQYGFTLVEMLVYLSIFAMVSAASIGFLFSLNDLLDQYRLETVLYRSGTGVMEQVLLAIRQADEVDLGNTTEDDPSAGRLTVLNDSSETEFLFTGTELQFIADGNNLGDLTGSAVQVEDFTVYHYGYDDREFVRIRLTLSGSSGGVTKELKLYGGAVVRGAI